MHLLLHLSVLFDDDLSPDFCLTALSAIHAALITLVSFSLLRQYIYLLTTSISPYLSRFLFSFTLPSFLPSSLSPILQMFSLHSFLYLPSPTCAVWELLSSTVGPPSTWPSRCRHARPLSSYIPLSKFNLFYVTHNFFPLHPVPSCHLFFILLSSLVLLRSAMVALSM